MRSDRLKAGDDDDKDKRPGQIRDVGVRGGLRRGVRATGE